MLRSAAQAIVFVAVSVVASSPASANLIVNGSFEAPDIPTGTFNVFPIIPGMWITYDGSGIEIQDNVAGSPCAGCGDQFVELDSFTSSAMYQEFATSVGQSYQVDFAYSPRPGRTEPDNVINVTWFGSSWHFLGTVSASGEGLLDTQWSSHSFDFIAETPASFLLFFDGGLPSFYSGILGGGVFNAAYNNSFGGYIDDVSVEAAVPEPASVTLLGGGLVGLAVFARRRRRS